MTAEEAPIAMTIGKVSVKMAKATVIGEGGGAAVKPLKMAMDVW